LDQADFVLALLEASGRAGLNRCLDTSGDVPEQLIQQLLTVVDCWLLDWKCSDPERHRELTGVDNHRIRRTLARLGEAGARIWLRCPLVPGLNDDEGHLRSISALSRRYAIERIQVMPYHRHGAGKAAAAGRVIHQAPSATLAQRRTWLNTLQHCGCLNLYEGASP
jgi:pyruvate formate lyase activating enzyme